MDQAVKGQAAARKRAGKLDTGVRREQLAQAALDLIGSQGLKGLNVAAVARRVGLVPSGVYKHFRDKEELVDAALDLIGDRLAENAALACRGTEDPVECLRLLMERHLALMQASPGIPRIVFSDDVYLHRSDRRARMFASVTRYLGVVADLIRRGQALGRMRTELDPATGAVLFLGLVQPAGILWHLSAGTFDAGAHLARAWRIFSSDVLQAPERRRATRSR